MTKLFFHISEDLQKSLTWEDFETLERAMEGDVKLYRLRPLLARFAVDENKKPIPEKEAMKAIGMISMENAPKIVELFMNAMKDKAIPKESGLLSPLESIPAEESPAGAQP